MMTTDAAHPSLDDKVVRALRGAAFTIETVAHLKQLEPDLLPLANRLRYFTLHARMPNERELVGFVWERERAWDHAESQGRIEP